MAEKVTGGEGKKTRKKKDGPGMGHNLTEIRKQAEDFFKRAAKLQEEMESQMGEFRSDFANLYEEAANKIGAPRQVLRREFRRYLRNLREEQEELEMEAVERDAIETLRASLEGTPFWSYVEGKLAGREKAN